MRGVRGEVVGAALVLLLAACGGEDPNAKGPGTMKDPVVEVDMTPDTQVPDPEMTVEVPAIAAPHSLETRLVASSVRAGDKVEVLCDVLDIEGNVIELQQGDDAPGFRVVVSPAPSLRRQMTFEFIAERAGQVSMNCASNDLGLIDDTPATLEITPGPAAAVVTRTDKRTLTAGDDVTASCTVLDAFGNEISDATPELVTAPMGDGVEVNGLVAGLTRSGIYTLSCAVAGAQSVQGVEVEVSPGLPANLAIAKVPDQQVYGLGQVVTIESLVTDKFNNPIPNADVAVTSMPAGQVFGAGRHRYDQEGTYTLTARVLGATEADVELVQSTTVVVNGTGPAIDCVFPADGQMLNMPVGDTIALTGSLNDAGGLATLKVNGQDTAIAADGSFEVPWTTEYGINFVDITATDTFGAQNSRTCAFLVSERWIPEGAFFSDAIALKLNQSSIDDKDRSDLDSLADILKTVLDSQGLKDTLVAELSKNNGRLLDDSGCRGFRTCIRYVDFQELKLDGPHSVDLDLVDDGLKLKVRVRNLGVRVHTEGRVVGIRARPKGWVNVDYIEVELTSDFRLVNNQPTIALRPGAPITVNAGRVDLDFQGFTGALINLLEGFFRGALRRQLEGIVRDFIRDEFNALLDGLVSGLDVSSLGSTFNVPRLDGSGDMALGFGVGFTTLDVKGPQGARALFGLSTSFTAPINRAGMTEGAPIPTGNVLLDISTTRPTGVAVHVGVLNDVFHTLWRAGFFDATIDGTRLSTGLPAGTTVVLDTALPPVLVLPNDKDTKLHIGAMNLTLTYPGIFDEPLFVTLGARANTTVSLQGDELAFGQIIIEDLFFSTPQVSLDETTRGVLESFLRTLLQNVIDNSLNNALPALPIPRFETNPTLGGYGLPYPGSIGLNNAALQHTRRHFILTGGFGF